MLGVSLIFSLQEPVAVSLSAVNIAINFHGWISFFILAYYKLPMTNNWKSYYEYTGLWHVYGFLAMNCWFWAAVFHCRLEQEGVISHVCCSVSTVGSMGWNYPASFTLEVTGGGNWRSSFHTSIDLRFPPLLGICGCPCYLAHDSFALTVVHLSRVLAVVT